MIDLKNKDKNFLLLYFFEKGTRRTSEKYIKKYHEEFYKKVLDFNKDFTIINSRNRNVFAQKLYNYIYKIKEYPTCVICGKKTKFYQLSKTGNGYLKTCSKKCASILGQNTIKKNEYNKNLLYHYTQRKDYKQKFKITHAGRMPRTKGGKLQDVVLLRYTTVRGEEKEAAFWGDRRLVNKAASYWGRIKNDQSRHGEYFGWLKAKFRVPYSPSSFY